MNKQDPLKVQTCVLRVNIHCDGCKQKVKKILQKVDGVYSVKIDSEQGKVTVSGNASPLELVKKLNKSGKQAELWSGGGGGQKGMPNNFQNQFNNQFMNMMQMSGKEGNKSQKGGGKGGGKEQFKGGMPKGGMPQHFNNVYKDQKMLSKDQKSVKFNLHDDEDDYSDEEDYTDEDGEDDFDHKHPPSKAMPFINGKGQGNGQGMNGMMMLNEKKGGGGGNGGGGGGKGKKGKSKDSDSEDDFDFDMYIKKGDKNGRKKEGKDKKGSGVMKTLGGLFGGGQKKSSKVSGKGDKNKNDHHHGGNGGGKNKGGGGNGGGGHNGKMAKDHVLNNVHGKKGGGKINGAHGDFQNINMNQGIKGNGGHKMGPMSHHMGGGGVGTNYNSMSNFQAAQGLPAQGGMNGGYYPHPNMGMGQGNSYNPQQQQYMAMMMNQQQQAAMHGGEMYHPMTYARPHPAVDYANGYAPPMPHPLHVNQYSQHMFSDENTEGCSIM